MKQCSINTRCGFSLLELIVTTAMLATLSASCMVIVRTSYTAWNRHQGDHGLRREGLAAMKHVVRQVRQAASVIAISPSSEISGSLSVLDTNGNVLVWQHDNSSNEVRFGIGTATNVLAKDIDALRFVGYKADGFTETTEPGLIHSIQVSTTVNINRPSSIETVSVPSRAWLRSW